MLAVNCISYQHKQFKILDEISFSTGEGKLIAIVGPNGAGKSTFLSYIANEIDAKHNKTHFKDKNLTHWQKHILPFHKAKFSQHQPSDIPLTVEEIVLMGRYPYFQHSPQAEDVTAIEKWMEKTEITHLRQRGYQQLSGGEKQRVHIARIFAQLENEFPNKLVLLDEPLNNLDVSHQFKLLQIIKEYTQEGNTVIMVIHDLNLASQYADEILLMCKGRVVKQATPDEVFQQDIISKVYNFPCTICQNPIDQKPLILFGTRKQ